MQFDLQYRKGIAALGAAAVLAAVAACSGGSVSPNGVNETQVSQDVASSTAGSVSEVTTDLGTSETQAGSANLVVPPTVKLSRISASMGRPSYSVSACTQGSFNGTWTFPFADPRDTITLARTWGFFAAGVCQNAFDPNSTDSIVFNATIGEELHGKRGFWDADRVGQRTHWVTGAPNLHSATTHVWNGFAAWNDTASFSGNGPESRSYVGTASDTVTNVTFPHPRNNALYPTGGTFTRWVNGTATFSGPTSGSRQFARHVVVTFNGSEFVPIVFYNVSNGQVALTCQLDLAEGDIVDGSCH